MKAKELLNRIINNIKCSQIPTYQNCAKHNLTMVIEFDVEHLFSPTTENQIVGGREVPLRRRSSMS